MCVAFSPDGQRLVVGTVLVSEENKAERGELKILDAASGDTMATLTCQKGAVSSVAYSPDGNRIVSRPSGRHPRSMGCDARPGIARIART